MDRGVVDSLGAKSLGVVGPDRRRGERQLPGVVAERTRPRVQRRLAVVVLGVCRKLVWGALVTEVVGVRAPSVVALVCC